MNALYQHEKSTAILRYPTGRYGLVGSVPVALNSRVWETEHEAITALLAYGCTRFQLADCSWYDHAKGA